METNCKHVLRAERHIGTIQVIYRLATSRSQYHLMAGDDGCNGTSVPKPGFQDWNGMVDRIWKLHDRTQNHRQRGCPEWAKAVERQSSHQRSSSKQKQKRTNSVSATQSLGSCHFFTTSKPSQNPVIKDGRMYRRKTEKTSRGWYIGLKRYSSW